MVKRRRYIIHLNPSHIDVGYESRCELYILSPVRAFLYTVRMTDSAARDWGLASDDDKKRALIYGGLQKAKEALDRVSEEDLVIDLNRETVPDLKATRSNSCSFCLKKGNGYVCTAFDHLDDPTEGFTTRAICQACMVPREHEKCRLLMGLSTVGVPDDRGETTKREARGQCQISQEQVIAECRPGHRQCWSFFYEVPIRRR